MTYFEQWNKEIELANNAASATEYVKLYYSLEKNAYNKILSEYPNNNLKGKLKDLSVNLGFADHLSIFVGFLEGLNSSLETGLNLEELHDDSLLDLKIDFEKLLYNMYEAKASWLYNLESWNKVFDSEHQNEICKKFRVEHIAVSNKIGRNEPCVCGSGKKYKNCCGKNN